MESLVEVRVLGLLSVRRRDGTTVAHRAWRTSKTRDLLRILAVHAGTPVPTDQLLEALWPAAEAARGRASLRTAASQIRQVIGKECVERQFDGLMLQHAWVDAVAFASLAAEARRQFAQGERAGGLATASEAAALYGGDLCSDEPYRQWAVADRERLRALRVTLLTEAGEAALALNRQRTAIRMADQVVACEPASERATRVLMRAHSALGETDRALGAYEHCREALADALGADPSRETRALHFELLSANSPEDVQIAFVGREAEMQAIRARVTDGLREEQGTLVVVSGAHGSGRTRLADEACAPWSQHLVSLCAGAHDVSRRPLAERLHARLRARSDQPVGDCDKPASTDGDLAGALTAAAPIVVRLDDLDQADALSVTRLGSLLAHLACPVAVVATSTPLAEAPLELAATVRGLEARGRAARVAVGALTRQAVTDLLAQALTEPAAPTLVEDVMARTAGHPGQVLQLVRDLTTAGGLTATHHGIERLPPEAAGAEDAEGVMQRVRAMLDPTQAPVFDIASVLGGPFTAGNVAGMCALSRAQVRATLDTLIDEGVLTEVGGEYRFREASVAAAAYGWLRPGTRRELHRLVAASPTVSEAARIEHWVAAGEPALACAAAMQAATQAAEHGEHERQRAYVVRARSLLDPSEATGRDRLALAESLGDAYHGMARFDEARAALEEAVSLARAHAPGELARLSRKLGDAAGRLGHGEAWDRYRQALTEASEDPVERVRTTSAIGAMLALRSPSAAVDALRNAVDMADAASNVAAQVEARVLLATTALAPMRRFAESEGALQQALAIADTSGDDALLAQGLLAGKQSTIALASSWQAVATLTRMDHLADEAGEPGLARDAQLLLALAAHELAATDFSWRWGRSWTDAGSIGRSGVWRWVPGRVLYERGHLAHADEVLARSLRSHHGAFDFQMVRLPAARLAAERGDIDRAVALLTAAVEHAVDTGVTVVLPEVAARLAVLEAVHDPADAAARLDQAEAALGEAVFPREQVAILLARAALQAADGQPRAAADLAGAAGAASRAAGLVFCHAETLTAQAAYLTTAGDRTRAVAALRRAGELYAHADAPARLRATSDLATRLGLDWETGVGAR